MPYRAPVASRGGWPQQPYRAGYSRAGYPNPAWAARPPAGTGSGAGIAVLVVVIVVLIAMILASAVGFVTTRGDVGGGVTLAPGTTRYRTTTETTDALTTTLTTTSTTTEDTTETSTATTPTGTAALADNPIFARATAALLRQPCNANGWPSDSVAGKRFFDSLSPCFDRAWSAIVTGAGMEYRSPTVLVPAGTRMSSPCGSTNLETENVAAFYCGSNETLYMPPAGMNVARYGNQPAIYLAVFAHEYGHHVQTLTGIMDAQWGLQGQYGRGTSRALEVSRRSELQAQCLSGLFVRSVTDTGGQFTSSDYPAVYEDQKRGDRPGDARDHGTYENYQAWWNTGYQTQRLARCNTWRASSDDVS